MSVSKIITSLTYDIFDQIDLLKELLDISVTDKKHRKNYEQFLDHADMELNSILAIIRDQKMGE